MLRQILPEEAAERVEEERRLLERVLAFAESFDPEGEEAARVRELIRHLDEMFLLVVVGEVKAGKSAFINALLGADLCPEGPLPLTDRVHVLAYGERPAETSLEAHVVRRSVPIEGLKRMNVVDTPGINSPVKRHQQITEAFLPRADIVFFVTSIDCPLTLTEIQLLGEIRERYRKEVACILAKIDMRSEKDQAVVLEYLRDAFREHIGFSPPVFPVSAQWMREARDGGDEELVERSGVPAVERYIVNNLTETQRLLLKLRSPLGTVQDLLGRVEAAAAARGRVLERDFAGWNAIQEQVSFAATSLKERAERQLTPIRVSFENLEARGRSFVRRTFRVRNLRLFADRARLQEAFEREVVRGAGEEVDVRVREAATWLGNETRALWERALAHFQQTVSLERYRTEIPAAPDLRFQETRRETLDRIVERARRDLAAFQPESECRRLRDLARRSFGRLVGTEVVAAGMGTAIAATLLPSVLGGVGLLLAAGVAAGGFLILPARRQRALEGFEQAVRSTRDALISALREAIGIESDRASAAVLDAFAPFHDFYESRRRNLKELQERVRELRAEVARFQGGLE